MSTTRTLRRLRYVLAAVAAFPVAAAGQEGPAAPGARLRSGTLGFVGHTTVGDFVGSTSTVAGEVVGDLSNLRGWVEAPAATLVTRNDRRDRDLRASLEVERYPTIRLDVSGATTTSSGVARDDAFVVLLHGRLTIHGVTRAVDLPVVVSRTADTMHVTAVFSLDLADYRVGGLTRMFGLLRMERQIQVRADLRFVSEEEPPESSRLKLLGRSAPSRSAVAQPAPARVDRGA